ncbi:RsmF rRNA methyltransferase first C-terminal domain-containing protein [Eubacterium xylanophilum]|uniref:RsmF rRNA methyltransferase first C-terminal domain-containing protein n=1 Tax=Eubacterium xylanophilum TaxID=39497 RepID=UPI00047B10E7|nr:RsmB/NOP family class I SAM-dependent RNA methyltransferase [Eubacterium xylanophilum]
MNLPETFLVEMKRILGDEYEAYLSTTEDTRQYGLRVNTSKISVEEFKRIAPFPIRKIPYISNGFYYDEESQPAKHPYYFAGLYYLQDPSAMTPASRLPISKGDRVLDLCAAPGGKATELGAELDGTGLLIANDISAKRAKALLKNIELFGIKNSLITTEYPEALRPDFMSFFDKILVDAPCSGEGMFRKSPSMIKAWEKNGPEFYSKLQREILDSTIPMLREGGMLLYSTCTFSPIENEGTVEYALSLDDSLELIDIEGYEGFRKGNPELINSSDKSIEKCVRIFPHNVDGEGHFLALFHKRTTAEMAGSEAMTIENVSSKKSKKKNDILGPLKGEDRELVGTFLKNIKSEFEGYHLQNKNGMVYLMPDEFTKSIKLRFLRSGLFLGEIKKKRFEPSQSLAVALKSSEYAHLLDLASTDPRVEKYLKGETINIEEGERDAAGEKGAWVLVCVDGYPLGWGKNTGSTLKNKYHQGWRMK